MWQPSEGALDATGYVNSEGGPFLIVDLTKAAAWHGADGNDYGRAIETIDDAEQWDGAFLPVGDAQGFLWGTSEGTIDVWCEENGEQVLLSHAFVEEAAGIAALSRQPWSGDVTRGRLSVASGWLLVLWAPESGAKIDVGSAQHGLKLDLSVGGAGLILRCQPGVYDVQTDEVAVGMDFARRCRLHRAA